MPRYGNETNFSRFFNSQNLKCSVSQSIRAETCGFIRDINVPLKLSEKFH